MRTSLTRRHRSFAITGTRRCTKMRDGDVCRSRRRDRRAQPGIRRARARCENLAVAPIGTGGLERSIDTRALAVVVLLAGLLPVTREQLVRVDSDLRKRSMLAPRATTYEVVSSCNAQLRS